MNMAAYAIGAITIHNTDWQAEYSAKMPALIKKYGGKPLTKSAAQLLEGNLTLKGLVVMSEFPSLENAQAWYDDPEHARLKELRSSGADFDLVLVNGL
jgi:uncharacterized protein (DUF1330 family)